MDLLSTSLQLLIVITPDWNSVDGTLYRYERSSINDEWQPFNNSIPVSVGKNGLAWGQGLHPDTTGPSKQEGDNKAPAGIFSLGPVFGNHTYAHHCQHMPFVLIEDGLEAVDDPQSIYYNQFIRRHTIATPDWNSSENMAKVGFQYDLGLVIRHNLSPIQPGKGSCIFMHIWRGPNMGTAGCTAMSEQHMIEIATWLDAQKNPLLIQIPIQETFSFTKIANLPKISAL